jgi:hypothetical protein
MAAEAMVEGLNKSIAKKLPVCVALSVVLKESRIKVNIKFERQMQQ